MADQVEVDLIIRALAEGFDKLGSDIGGLGKAAETATPKVQKTGLSLTDLKSGIDLATQAAQIAGGVFQQAFDLAAEGAQLIDTTESLERLAEQSGYAGDLMEELEKAAGGTVDDLDYMGSTIRLLTGETGEFSKRLATAAPQLLTMARAAVKLNPTLGDTAAAYEAITKAIETGQVRALKDYGILIDATGTKEERLQQILEAMPGLMEQVGGNVETTSDSVSRFNQVIDDGKDKLQLFLANGLLPIIDGVFAFTDAIEKNKEAAIANNMTFDEYVQSMGAAGPIIQLFNTLTDGATEASLAAAQAVAEQEAETTRLMNATTAANTATVAWAENTFYAQQAQDAAKEATLANKDAMEQAKEAAENIAGAFKNVGLNAYEAQVWTTLLAVATGNMSQEEADAALNLLDVQKAVADGVISMGDYFAVMLDGQITMEEYNTLMGTTTEALEAETEAAFLAEGQNRKLTDSQEGVTEKAPAMIQALNDIAMAADLAAGDRYINFHITQSGAVPGGANTTDSNQEYDTGGIVPGSYAQAVPIVAHGSEMILNPEQQSNLFALLNGGGQTGGGSVIQVVLDGRVIAETMSPYLGSMARQAVANGAGRYG